MNYVKLKDVCTINMGQSPSSDSYNENGHGVPFFQGNADFGERYPVTRKWCSAPTKMAAPEDILISVRAPIGAMNYAKEECCIGRGLAALTPNREKVAPEYIFWLLKSKDEELNCKGTGSTFKAIGRNILEETLVPNISLEKQTECAIILEKTYRVILSRKQQLQKLDELVKARFVEMFGDPEINSFDWPVCTLKELVSFEPQNGLYKPQSAYVQDGSGFPIVRIDAFYNGRITNFSALKRLECSESEVQRYLLQENDIVINRVNSIEYLGKCAHIKGLLEETVFESNMMRLHLDDTVMNAVFATKLLCSQYIYKQIMIRAKKAVNQASINQQDVLSFRMFVPPLELQEQFAAFVEQTDKSKVVVQKALSTNVQYFTI